MFCDVYCQPFSGRKWCHKWNTLRMQKNHMVKTDNVVSVLVS